MVVLVFAKVPSIKYWLWNKPNFFDSETALYGLWEKNGTTKSIDYALPLTRIRTLLTEANLKMSTILFVLLYIRYKGQIWDSHVYPWLHRQVDHQLQRQMHLFLHNVCNFLCFLMWILRCTFKCNIEYLLKSTFYWAVLWTPLH